MKHLFNDISQDEKDRILEMHKGAINSEMINEQPARFIGQGLRKGAQYVKQFVDDTGRALGDAGRTLGRTLNPQKVQILGGGQFNTFSNSVYNKAVGQLLRQSGTIKNNQYVQNELRDFNSELYQFNKLYNSKIRQPFPTSDGATALKSDLERINNLVKTPLDKPLDLAFIYQHLIDLKRIIRTPEYYQISGKTLQETIESFETAVTNILSQAGR